jgi:hypothetical protein
MNSSLVTFAVACCWLICADAAELPVQPGVTCVFFNESVLQRPADCGVQPQIRMETKGADFGWLWFGKIRFPQTAEVTMSAVADDGLRLFVGDSLVIDGPDSRGNREAKLQVTAGETRSFWLEYYQRGGDAKCELFWQWAGHPREAVPASALFHDQRDAQLAQAILEGKASGMRGVPTVVQAPAGDEADNSHIYRPGGGRPAEGNPIRLGPGPHMFLDDYLIAESRNLERRVHRPQRDSRIPNPLITGKEDECNGPYMTVIRDPAGGMYRIWYNTNKVKFQDGSSHVATMQSRDGIHWIRPHRVLADPGAFDFGSSVLDEGPGVSDPSSRYKLAWYSGGGLRLAVSSDGLDWKPWKSYAVIRHSHDITNIFYDGARRRYLATISVYNTGPNYSGQRRCTMQTASTDLLNWEKPWYVLRPDDRIEKDQTQFYAMCGYLQRGDLLIGLVKVLHDDWKAAGTPEGAYGMGYTSLAWSRDAVHWTRDLEPFFEPDPNVDAWDHAHAWIDQQLPVGDDVYLYYGGYKFGHKMDRWEGRQIGMVKMQRDRYVSRAAGRVGGTLRTPAVLLTGQGMSVNANIRGELRAALLSQDGKPIPGFSSEECQPVSGDGLAHEIHWKNSITDIADKAVRIEFSMRDGELYSFDLR